MRWAVLGVFAVLCVYMGWSVGAPLGPWGGGVWVAIQLVLLGFILWMPLVFWKKESGEATAFERVALGIAYSGAGLLSFVLVLSLARDLLCLFWPPRTALGSVSVLGGSLLGLLMGAWIAHFELRLKRTRIQVSGLACGNPRATLKIAQITDLHVGPTIRKKFVDSVVKLANEAEPDLIVLTGDLADGMVGELLSETAPLAGLKAKHGKYYVPGNHEFYWDGPGWIERMRALGITPLINRHEVVQTELGAVSIAGVPDPAGAMIGFEKPDFVKAIAGTPSGLRIVLCHQPQFASQAEAAGFDLMISGHTHGGQFFPWTLIAAWVHRFNVGLGRLSRMQIYVSPGTGYWGPPVRLGSPPEVALLEIVQS